MKSHVLILSLLVLMSAPLQDAAGEDAKADQAAKIQWFGTWARAKAEAQRTGRPLLLTAAAPQCKGTPGIW